MNVGMAQVDYTPPPGLPLLGNYRDDYAAKGVHDPLFAHALVVEGSDGEKAAMLSADIAVLSDENVSMMRRLIASQCDLSPQHILIASTHTHSAPAATSVCGLPKADGAAVEAFLGKIASAVVEANGKLRPASLSVGSAQEHGLAFNRRLKCEDGQTHMNWEDLDVEFVIEPWGPTAPEVVTLWVERDGHPEGAMVNFAMHPAILAGDNWLYSADYPGCLYEALCRTFGDDFVTLFMNGCCGNVNHVDYRDKTQGRGFPMTQRVGYMLAVAAMEAKHGGAPVRGDQIRVSSESVTLDRIRIDEAKREWAEGVLKGMEGQSAGQVDGLPDDLFAREWLDLYEKQDAPDDVEVMVMRIGDLAVVGLPGEAFCEFGMQIKERSPARHTMVVELANGGLGYFPTRASFEQGGYEPTPGATFHGPGAGEKLVASAMDQLSGLFKG